MDHEVILDVKFNGECKLITVNRHTSFDEFKKSVLRSWFKLQGNAENISFSWSVGSIQNCILGCSEDLQNLVSYSQICSGKIVKVSVRALHLLQNLPIKVDRSIGPSSDSVNALMSPFQEQDHLINVGHPVMSSSPQINVAQKIPFKSVKKFKSSNDKLQKDFEQTINVPSYDICPSVSQKPLLSDSWSSTFNGGIGTEFRGGVVEFRKAIIKFSTQVGFKISYLRNDSRYVHAVCNEFDSHSCDWFVKGRLQSVTKYFVITSSNLVHKCSDVLIKDDTTRLSPKIMAELIMQHVRTKPKISGKDIMDILNDDYGLKIPYWKAWRTVEAAKKQIFGTYDESYDQLKWYCNAIERTNPGSAVVLECNKKSNCFERLFISFKACLDGFKSCRPLLFIDGTFMKGRSKGILLPATGKDGDNGLFPVAFAVVSAENTDNWAWFLSNCRDYIKHNKQLIYISDRNVGLMSAFPKVFQEPLHFFCLFHLITNLKGRFGKGWNNSQRSNMADHFREVAYAPSIRLFEEKLAIFKEAGGPIAEHWLEDLPYDKWAVAHAPQICRYGEMTSNAAESFNAWISDYRSFPITYMIDSIRNGISRWHLERRQECLSWTGALCPSKEKWWNHLINKCRTWSVVLCPSGEFEVGSSPSVRVDLQNKSCSCCQWKVRGFPCSHAVAVIRKNASSVFSYVEDCFFTTKYQECYMFDIHPIPETERFECQASLQTQTVLPPVLNRPPDRPKKKRNPSFGEYKNNEIRICGRCGKLGKHDMFTCLLADQ